MTHSSTSPSHLHSRPFFRLSRWVRRWFKQYQPPEEVALLSAAILVGLGTAISVVLLISLIGQVKLIAAWIAANIGSGLGLLLVMGIGGLLVGLIAYFTPDIKGPGVAEVMEAAALRSGRIQARIAPIKLLVSALTIGAGGSAGREGPTVQIGASIGSALGRLMHLSDQRIRTLVACGAAAGISAAFNAPIAGAIFALEVILARFTVRYFGAVVISAVSAGILSRAFLGDKPAFDLPAYPLNHPAELPIYILLGCMAAPIAVAFMHLMHRISQLFTNWRIPVPLKTTIGMLLTAGVALLLPDLEILGSSLEVIGETITRGITLSLGMTAVLLLLKMLVTCFTIGSGNAGGVLAPSLFIGAILGSMVGNIAHQAWPEIAPNIGAYAIVGMAAVFSGTARAPITAVLIVFEMSGDYKLILPLMLATVLSTLLAERLLPDSIYALELKLKGVTLQSGRDVDILQSVLVEEVMQRDLPAVSTTTTLTELSDIFSLTRRRSLAVLDEHGRLAGIVTITDLEWAIANHLPRSTPVAQICTDHDHLLRTYTTSTIGEALSQIGTRGIGQLPVVSPDTPRQLMGMLDRDDIIRAYNLAVTRRATVHHHTRRVEMRSADSTEFIDFMLMAGDRAIGTSVQVVARQLPRDCILISIRRDGRVFIPHGDTTFQLGDHVTAFVRSNDVERVYDCLRRRGESEGEGEAQERDWEGLL